MSQCHVARLLDSLDGETADLLEQALSMPVERVGHKPVRELLQANADECRPGIPSARVIRRHRSKECSCNQ